MVEDRITDGVRIGELLASEVEGRSDGGLANLAVTNANRDVEPTADGARAFDLVLDRTGDRLASAFVHEDRLRLSFVTGREAAVETAETVGLAVDSDANGPGRSRVLVESGAAVKRATDVLAASARAVAGTETNDGEERERW